MAFGDDLAAVWASTLLFLIFKPGIVGTTSDALLANSIRNAHPFLSYKAHSLGAAVLIGFTHKARV